MEIINFGEQKTLISQFMKQLRDKEIQKNRLLFRNNLERIGQIMAYEISKRLQYEQVEVTTPLAVAKCNVISEKIVLGTILRAGLPFHQGFLNYFDNAENAFVSAYRKYKEKDDFEIHIEYIASPRLDDKTLILVDPMLATGASMELAYQALLTKGHPAHIHVASVIASRQAVNFISHTFPNEKTTLWIADIDEKINAHSYIVPGLGDAGDLAFGEK
ncbi:MAG: uracil phosphoribosyltransferase [Muribaculaceae bacterium]|jgi:uracil phosphoribosyltransferase|nr:uracil phosphoribosyltransferase [Muribaculaceae bacterium]